MTDEEKKTRALQAGTDMIGVCVDVICSRAEVGVLSALSLVNKMSLSLMARIDAQSAADFGVAVADAMRAESAAAETQALQRQKGVRPLATCTRRQGGVRWQTAT